MWGRCARARAPSAATARPRRTEDKRGQLDEEANDRLGCLGGVRRDPGCGGRPGSAREGEIRTLKSMPGYIELGAARAATMSSVDQCGRTWSADEPPTSRSSRPAERARTVGRPGFSVGHLKRRVSTSSPLACGGSVEMPISIRPKEPLHQQPSLASPARRKSVTDSRQGIAETFAERAGLKRRRSVDVSHRMNPALARGWR